MPGPLAKAVARTARHVPGLRRVRVLRVVAVAEVVMIARDHISNLTAGEWRRMAELIRLARGRPGNLGPAERAELGALVAKAEPRRFAGRAIEKLSPVALPSRLLYGPSKRRRLER